MMGNLLNTYVLTNGSVQQLVAPAAVTATANSAAITLPGPIDGDAAMLINNGAITGAPTSVTAQLQSSPDGTTWTAQGSPATISAAGAQMIPFKAADITGPLLRVAFTVVGGTSPSVTVSAEVVSWPTKY